MLEKDLFDEALLRPALEGADKLYVVAGYASPTMVSRHFQKLKGINKNVSINLIVGMCVRDGLPFKVHEGFKQLVQGDYSEFFDCRYLVKLPPVHSKVYSWFVNDKPYCGFVGSANYTQTSFSILQRDILTPCEPDIGREYYQKLIPDTFDCRDSAISRKLEIFQEKNVKPLPLMSEEAGNQKAQDLEMVTTSLLANDGSLPDRSGLNWGHRPEYNRNKNQAYIRLPSSIYRSDFFPDRSEFFTVLTDDDKVLICTRAQDNGKAIETPHNNSLLGEYFRSRLGLASGKLVLRDHLVNYGRTDLDFYKIDDETYFMDFSVK